MLPLLTEALIMSIAERRSELREHVSYLLMRNQRSSRKDRGEISASAVALVRTSQHRRAGP